MTDDERNPAEINEIQALIFEIMARARYNLFDGADVVKSLKANRGLWDAILFGRFGQMSQGVTLRDLPDGIYNADTLMILTDKERVRKLKKLAKNDWCADEIDAMKPDDMGAFLGSYRGEERETRVVLRVWWD